MKPTIVHNGTPLFAVESRKCHLSIGEHMLKCVFYTSKGTAGKCTKPYERVCHYGTDLENPVIFLKREDFLLAMLLGEKAYVGTPT